MTADQAAQLAREALPSPTAFDETWYRIDAVLVPPPERRTRRGTLHPRHLAMAGEGHARGSLLVPEAFRPHVLDAAFGRVLGAHAAREGADRAFGAALNVSRVGGGAWADADVAPLAALLPLLEAHADYVAGYHRSDGEVCNASAAAERASRPAGAAVMGLELMLNSCEMGIVPLAAVRVDGGALGCPRHPLGDVEEPPPAVAQYFADGAAVADDAEAACAEWAAAGECRANPDYMLGACAAACARADAGAAAARPPHVVRGARGAEAADGAAAGEETSALVPV